MTIYLSIVLVFLTIDRLQILIVTALCPRIQSVYHLSHVATTRISACDNGKKAPALSQPEAPVHPVSVPGI